MNLLLSTVSFSFDSVANIGMYEETIRKIFLEEFPTINALNAPDVVPPEIPRFVLISHHGFSTLVVTSNMIQLTTKFDEAFSSQWEKRCKPYLQKKTVLISCFLREIGINVRYTGLTINSLFSTKGSSVQQIERKFVKQKLIANLDLYDIMQKQTFVYKDTFFINLQIQNQRYPDLKLHGFETVSDVAEDEKCAVLVIDINDRKVANKERSYISSEKVLDEIFEINNSFMKFGFESIVSGGESLCLN